MNRPILQTVIILVFLLVSMSSVTAIDVPSCERLKEFPLDDVGTYGTDESSRILEEYFGLPLSKWTEADFPVFVSTLVRCRERDSRIFNRYLLDSYLKQLIAEKAANLKNKQIDMLNEEICDTEGSKRDAEVNELSEQARALTITEKGLQRLQDIRDKEIKLAKTHVYTCIYQNVRLKMRVDYVLNEYETALNDKKFKDEQVALMASRKEEEMRQQAIQVQQSKELLLKYGKIGPPPSFLLADLRTMAGGASSGSLCSVIQFYHGLKGQKKWEKREDLWVLTQNAKDVLTEEKHQARYAFRDLTATNGFVWLDRAVIDKTPYPTGRLIDLVETTR